MILKSLKRLGSFVAIMMLIHTIGAILFASSDYFLCWLFNNNCGRYSLPYRFIFYLSVYLIAVLGIGLLISTYAETQQQAMSIAFLFMMIFILMSGLFTPIDSMTKWAYVITQFSPVTYFIELMRMIVLKGSGLSQIKNHFFIIAAFAVFLNGWAVLNYKKTS